MNQSAPILLIDILEIMIITYKLCQMTFLFPLCRVLCGGLWLMLGVTSIYILGLPKVGWVTPVQLFMLALASAIVFSTSYDFERGRGLQLMNQVAAWTLLGESL